MVRALVTSSYWDHHVYKNVWTLIIHEQLTNILTNTTVMCSLLLVMAVTLATKCIRKVRKITSLLMGCSAVLYLNRAGIYTAVLNTKINVVCTQIVVPHCGTNWGCGINWGNTVTEVQLKEIRTYIIHSSTSSSKPWKNENVITWELWLIALWFIVCAW